MKTAETVLNTKVTFKANDAEHKAFKLACVDSGEDMARLFRDFERQYVKRYRKRKK